MPLVNFDHEVRGLFLQEDLGMPWSLGSGLARGDPRKNHVNVGILIISEDGFYPPNNTIDFVDILCVLLRICRNILHEYAFCSG